MVLLDGAKTIGAKILVAGGGRCNVTHDRISLADYNGSKNIVRNVLAAFDENATIAWFESVGVILKREPTGKLFPITDSARTVLNALVGRCGTLGVKLWTDHRVHDVLSNADGTFTVRHAKGEISARRVIFATGGRSLPRTGSDGAGFEIVRRLGHTVTATFPALVPLVLDGSMFHAELSGLSHEAELSTFAGGKLVDRRSGSLLWTHFGISGPVVMDASRHWTIAQGCGGDVEMRCSFMPGESFEEVERSFMAQAAARPRASAGTLISQMFPERLTSALFARAGLERGMALAQMLRGGRRGLIQVLTALRLPILRDRGWNYAEVTAGGVPLHEIDYRTMGSRKIPNLYLIGEILDCDGRIGGFNFQWAWSTGYLAGKAAARCIVQ